MGLCRVPYISLDNKHYRPSLEVIFHFNKVSTPITFGLVDSGADHIVIPYSLGSRIGLPSPTNQEQLLSASGVGGSVNYVEKQCTVFLINKPNKLMYGFKETVWWIYPNKALLKQMSDLMARHQRLKKYQDQCKPNTELGGYFKNEMNTVFHELVSLNNKLEEAGVLLGRPFFNNFRFIQFFQKDRGVEKTCFFNYQINKKKVNSTIKLP
ncbi:hypothetical protein A2160_05290 [Candidatus Beckwithbacteria bacterium RBG_13_42_9]|uniref:Peptidase A2 domain-containing protein n=1 Tax=Candidatus Beckwithbacteria bacterium RBG_13_42_9 TaxID=1797457 RepID=A0A1F5E6U7_9BACT|nr:MAG: hypothetical protein A2160_05290 [Candidatus Beckwithbacteria bacterium RBG_13_42_9]